MSRDHSSRFIKVTLKNQKIKSLRNKKINTLLHKIDELDTPSLRSHITKTGMQLSKHTERNLLVNLTKCLYL